MKLRQQLSRCAALGLANCRRHSCFLCSGIGGIDFTVRSSEEIVTCVSALPRPSIFNYCMQLILKIRVLDKHTHSVTQAFCFRVQKSNRRWVPKTFFLDMLVSNLPGGVRRRLAIRSSPGRPLEQHERGVGSSLKKHSSAPLFISFMIDTIGLRGQTQHFYATVFTITNFWPYLDLVSRLWI